MQAQEDIKPHTKKDVAWIDVTETNSIKSFDLQNAVLNFEMPSELLNKSSSINLFKRLFDEDIWNLLQDQTNKYMKQCKHEKQSCLNTFPGTRLTKYKDVTK